MFDRSTLRPTRVGSAAVFALLLGASPLARLFADDATNTAPAPEAPAPRERLDPLALVPPGVDLVAVIDTDRGERVVDRIYRGLFESCRPRLTVFAWLPPAETILELRPRSLPEFLESGGADGSLLLVEGAEAHAWWLRQSTGPSVSIEGFPTFDLQRGTSVVDLDAEFAAIGFPSRLRTFLRGLEAQRAPGSRGVRDDPELADLVGAFDRVPPVWLALDLPAEVTERLVAELAGEPRVTALLEQTFSIREIPPLDGLYVGVRPRDDGGIEVEATLRFGTEQGAADVAKAIRGASVLPLPIPPLVKRILGEIRGKPQGKRLDLRWSAGPEIFSGARTPVDKARSAMCIENFREIYSALRFHAQQNRLDRFIHDSEGSLAALRQLVASPHVKGLEARRFCCSCSTKRPKTAPGETIELSEETVSYVLVPWRVTLPRPDDDQEMLMYDETLHAGDRRIVLFASGSVREIDEAEFRTLYAEQEVKHGAKTEEAEDRPKG